MTMIKRETVSLLKAAQNNVIWTNFIKVKLKKRSCLQVDFAISADHKAKMKESELIDKYVDLIRGLKKVVH